MSASRAGLVTACAVALVAYAACDMIHEALGHGLACAILPGTRALSISTVALQTSGENRAVAAAGSVANLIFGALCFALFDRKKGFDATRYFLWLLATINWMNGVGYLLFSGLLDYGDWAVVIAGQKPHWMWRVILGACGIAGYWAVVRFSARRMASLVRSGLMNRRDVRRLVVPSYVAGGLLLVAGAARNPIGPQLILLSGLSSGFAAMAGLLLLPGLVERDTNELSVSVPELGLSAEWIAIGIAAAVIFVGILGPGIPLSRW